VGGHGLNSRIEGGNLGVYLVGVYVGKVVGSGSGHGAAAQLQVGVPGGGGDEGPLDMPPDLRAAHRTLDARVERHYRAKKFNHDTERVQHLFERYVDLSAPLAPASKAPAKPRSRNATDNELA
jgi:hypothetical protein